MSNRVFLLPLLLVSSILLVSSQLEADGQNRFPTAACPYGSLYPDGCPDAPQRGSFQRLNFPVYATQSGQKWSLPHPQPWNIAGVDYAVGYPMTSPLLDPAKAVLPVGCTFEPRGSIQQGARVICKRVADPVIKGIDFSLHGCTVLEFSELVTGTITIKDNNFKNGPNCAVQNGYLVKVDGGPANFDFEYNQVDGNFPAYTAYLVSSIVTGMPRGHETFAYNAFINSPQRPITTTSAGDILVKFNYGEGWVMAAGAEHGEFLEVVPQANSTIQNATYSFNTMLTPSSAPSSGGTATFYFDSKPGGAANYLNVVVDHNTVVTNSNGGNVTIAAALAEFGWSIFHRVKFNENYVDATGAYACLLNLGGAARVIGSVSGRILTVDSIGIGALYPGSTFGGAGLSPAVIEPYGTHDPITGRPSTGKGGAGTYVLRGNDQFAHGTNWGALDSPILDSLSISRNVNLIDGSSISGMGFEWQGAVCHGHNH